MEDTGLAPYRVKGEVPPDALLAPGRMNVKTTIPSHLDSGA